MGDLDWLQDLIRRRHSPEQQERWRRAHEELQEALRQLSHHEEGAQPSHYSGILVMTDPAALDRCRADLEALPGVEVHYCYPDSGRLIAVQETATAQAQEEGLRRIQELPSVRLAGLVEHRIDTPAVAGEENE